jgi:hypothetical protein
MRIKGNRSTDGQGFWPQTLKWFRSQRGFTQFMMGFGLGFVLAGLLAIGYKLGGWKYIDPLAVSLPAQVKELEKEVVKNDLPILYLDIGFEEFQSMASQRDEALSTGVLILGEEDWVRAEIRFQGETIPIRG